MSNATDTPKPPVRPTEPVRKRQEPPNEAKKPPMTDPPPDHEGAIEEETGDRTGPGAGYDNEPEQDKDTGGIAPS